MNTDRERISISILGYSKAYVDITTIGISGALTFDLESKEEVRIDQLS